MHIKHCADFLSLKPEEVVHSSVPYVSIQQLVGRIVLHSHLEGSVPATSLRKIADRNGVELPFDLEPAKMCRHVYNKGWPAFISIYNAIASCFQQAEDFRDSLCDYATVLCTQGVAYAEIYCTPWLHMCRGVSLSHIAHGLQAAVMWSRENLPTDIRILVDLMRSREEPATDIVDWFLRLPADIFVGLGLTGGPDSVPLDSYQEVSQRVRSARRGLVVHAGELEGPHSVREAIYTLHANRIGHGLRLLEDPSLADEISTLDVHFELCPSSNRQLVTQLNLPCLIERFNQMGFSISINPDDELIFNTSALDEILWVLMHTCLSLPDLFRMQRDAAKWAFADQATKNELIWTFDEEGCSLASTNGGP